MPRIDAAMPEARSPWRWFPWGVAGCMLVVIIVNVGMAWSAYSTFPGKPASNGFSESNKYNRIMEKADQEAAHGWKLDANTEGGQAILRLGGRDGAGLSGAQVAARAVRPLGDEQATALAFKEVAPGIYRATTKLPDRGQWDLMVEIVQDSNALHATRRVLVR